MKTKFILGLLLVFSFSLISVKTFASEKPLPYSVSTTEHIANGVEAIRGEVESVPLNILKFHKNGPYNLKFENTGKTKEMSKKETYSEFAKSKGAIAVTNAGFWSYATVNNAWDQREIGLGKKGVLYSDGDNNFRAGVFGVTKEEDISNFIGKNGWEFGAFGSIIEDGKIQTRWETGDPDVKTARSMFVEFNDGVIMIIQNGGHSSTKNGLNHSEMVNLLRNFGIQNIKLAFNMDGGGSTRMYTKSDAGVESFTGAFVDSRKSSTYLYLVKDENYKEKQIEAKPNNQPSEKPKSEKSVNITAPNTGVKSENHIKDILILLVTLCGLLSIFTFRKYRL